MADRFLRRCQGGTDRTYAYLLVDHLLADLDRFAFLLDGSRGESLFYPDQDETGNGDG
jgi:hypothetical protein